MPGPPISTEYTETMDWLDEVKWDRDGLVPAIAQEADSGDVLMFAWMNREALALTLQRGEAVYWSRSRRRLWHKGEESGHVQQVHEIRLDCDADVVLLKVTQRGHEPGIACHTGRHSCFYRRLDNGAWSERACTTSASGNTSNSAGRDARWEGFLSTQRLSGSAEPISCRLHRNRS